MLGNVKKVKAKDTRAFEILTEGEIEHGGEISAGGELSFRHSFSLEQNSPISDKAQSPYILFGNSLDSAALGQLLLTVAPHPYVRSVFDSLTTIFSFINKGESWKGGVTNAKLKAHDARRFSMVEELESALPEIRQKGRLLGALELNLMAVGTGLLNGARRNQASTKFLMGPALGSVKATPNQSSIREAVVSHSGDKH